LFRMIGPGIFSWTFPTFPIWIDSFEHFRKFWELDSRFFLHEKLSLFIQSLINFERLQSTIS